MELYDSPVCALTSCYLYLLTLPYFDHLERTKFLAPLDTDLEIEDPDDDIDESWPENPVMGAEELLRFSRARQLLLP